MARHVFLRFMCAVCHDIKESCRDKLFLVKSNVSTNFFAIERKFDAIEIPATELRFDYSLSQQKEPMSQQSSNSVAT